MNILFDLNHPVDVNFFKQVIFLLKSQEHNVIITYRPRGKLQKIIDYELSDFNCTPIGGHYKVFVFKVLGQLYRDVIMCKFQRKNKIDLSVCFGSTNAISSWLNNIPYLAFDDDIEYKIPFYHANIFSTRHIMPDRITFTNSKTHKYKGFKELAYLHPNYFTPKETELAKYGIKENYYVFIREIANVSLNYKKENKCIRDIIKALKLKGYQIVISLEDENLEKSLKDDCIILEEPVTDIYSIIKFSKFVISSGDTMAREACLLGTPCIYTGGREMVMNSELIEMGAMFKADDLKNVIEQIDVLSISKTRSDIERQINHMIRTTWEDTTSVILKHIRSCS